MRCTADQEGAMAKKVTMSIPDMLNEKLATWLKSFNLSKMSQDTQKKKIIGDYSCHIHASSLLLNSNTHSNSEYFPNYQKWWEQGIELFWEEVLEKL
jgi:hypothetical protein